MVEKRRPPIDIEELEEKAPEKRGPGRLTYTDTKERRGGSSGGRGNVAQLLVAVIAAVVISIFAIIQLAPSKGQLNEVIAGHNALATQVAGLTATLSSTNSRLDNTINSLAASYATKGDLSRFVTSDSITALSTQISMLSSDIAALKSDIAALKSSLSVTEGKFPGMATAIASLEARIKVLEGKPVPIPVVSQNITTAIVSGGGESYTVVLNAAQSGNYIVRVNLVYSSPVALIGADYLTALEYFHTRVTSNKNRNYIPELTYDGTTWKLVSIVFYSSPITQSIGSMTYSLPILGLTNLSGFNVYPEVVTGTIGVSTSTGGI